MEFNEFVEKYSPFLRRYWLPLALAVLGLIFLGYGMIQYLDGNKDKQDIFSESASTSSLNPSDSRDVSKNLSAITNSDKQNSREGTIVVDIEGAVQKPGVYKLPLDGRVQDVLILAGGLGKDADREKVAKSLNLAARLTDGGKIYIPFKGEGENQVVLGESNGVININSASESELDSLPGVGRVTANKIIVSRPYGGIKELVQKKIVGQKVFENIKDKISVY